MRRMDLEEALERIKVLEEKLVGVQQQAEVPEGPWKADADIGGWGVWNSQGRQYIDLKKGTSEQEAKSLRDQLNRLHPQEGG